METRTTTNRTAEAIRQAFNKSFESNRRKQVFQAIAETGGNGLIIAPASEWITEDDNYKGYCNIQRIYWYNMPGYAERVCNELLKIMES